ncbi:MAG TPA: hypothetical protein PK988_05140 [Candidatus Sumerlaeota bacterium]|nr:hypothetical protein [Candidatus Sumerlaeota bacterium]
MKRFALLALPLAITACGDNNDENRPIDAGILAIVDVVEVEGDIVYRKEEEVASR